MTSYLRTLDRLPAAFQGSNWTADIGFLDTATGQPADFTTGALASLAITMTMVDSANRVLATLDRTGTADGTITGSSSGILSCFLPAAMVSTLPATADFQAATDPAATVVRSRSLITVGLVATDTNGPWSLFATATQLVVFPSIGATAGS